MEEYDDLEQGPNEDGSFNLSYNDWHIIPYDLCEEYRDRLIYLNLSNNNLVEITAQIGNLSLLKELNLSHNKLKTIDVALGQCIRLRKLDLSYNELLSIPVEVILQCKLLDSLHLNNNQLTILPNEICSCSHALELLDASENNLEAIPTGLYTIKCLKKLYCHGNNNLTMIPKAMRGKPELVLWTLKLHQTFKDQVSNLKENYYKIETNTKMTQMKRLLLEEEKIRLQKELEELEQDRPGGYLEKKESFFIMMHKCKTSLRNHRKYFRKKIDVLFGRPM